MICCSIVNYVKIFQGKETEIIRLCSLLMRTRSDYLLHNIQSVLF